MLLAKMNDVFEQDYFVPESHQSSIIPKNPRTTDSMGLILRAFLLSHLRARIDHIPECSEI
jgi:hypothetical protein